MSPELLNKSHYKIPADIYSFSISMLEMITWQDAFPHSKYKFPWDIANSISQGKRPDLINEIDNEIIKECIELSWKQEPKERIQINEIIKKLEQLF